MSNKWPGLCWCCFLDIPVGEETVGIRPVCQTCRDLDCDVPNPDGCLRPGKYTKPEEITL